MMLLQGQVAIVTGAASLRGIGRATATLFAEHGASVALLDIDAEGATAAALALGPNHRGYRCDVTDGAAINEVFTQVAADLGPPTILVNNAGISRAWQLDAIGRAEYDSIMDINLRGVFFCAQAAARLMRPNGGGSIVNIASVAGKRGGGVFGTSVYAASKAGVMGLTRALARELAADHIRVNAVAPGLIDTDIFGGQLTDERRAQVLSGIPLGRLGTPLDVARICLFLASELADYVTGEIVDVNGGFHID